MPTNKYNTMHQHEPLSVPRRWSGEEIRFATQLEETLDDIYRIINRLKLSDLSGDLKLTDKDGNETVNISAGGDITAKSVTADSIIIKGQDLLTVIKESFVDKVIVSDTQPDAHGVVWIKPVTGSGQSGDVLEEVVFSGTPAITSVGAHVDITIPLNTKTGEVNGQECKYHAAVRLRNSRGKRLLTGIQMTLVGSNGNEQENVQVMNVTDLNALLSPGDYIVVDNEAVGTSPDYDNLTYGNAMTVALHLDFSDEGILQSGGQTTVRAYATREDQSGDAVKACEVYYLS